ncbi:MAG: Fic family protein [Solirubrobacterales bacterium]|nr:Fic family protein [Solirubrobacterales bacterium]
MESFRDLTRHFSELSLDVVAQLVSLGEGRGAETAARVRRPHELATLREIAVVQSIETSNAIEGIHAPSARIRKLATEKVTPRDRPEQEIAGYRFVLGEIHEQGLDIPFEPRYVLQLHGHLYRFTGARHAGSFKRTDNKVVERASDGAVVVRFTPVDAQRTPAAMEELHQRFTAAERADEIPYPLLCAAYVLDFLTIHPFTDGNGRMARLITLWLLYRGGFGVGRYISLERIVADTKVDYYDALAASTESWHENRHDLLPWTRYLLGVIVAAYREFEERIDAMPAKSTDKRELVRAFIETSGREGFAVGEVLDSVPVSRDYLGKLLREFRAEELVEMRGAGRGTRWHRVRRASE